MSAAWFVPINIFRRTNAMLVIVPIKKEQNRYTKHDTFATWVDKHLIACYFGNDVFIPRATER